MGISVEPDSFAGEPPSEESVVETPSVGGWVEDALLDVMLELRCVHSFDGVAALEARAQLDRLALPLPIHLMVWDSKAGRWSLPDRFGFYSEMLIAVQLATDVTRWATLMRRASLRLFSRSPWRSMQTSTHPMLRDWCSKRSSSMLCARASMFR